MKFLTRLSLAVALVLAGCSSGNGVGTPQLTAFPQFVRDQVAETAESTDPVDIDGLDFVDVDTPDDFAELLE